jgi:phosphatidylserine decarboxylase
MRVETTTRLKPINDLVDLLESDASLKNALELSIQKAKLSNVGDLDQFYSFLEQILTHIPTEKELMPSVREFYYLLSKSPDDVLRKNPAFTKWVNDFVDARGNFLDSPESVRSLDTFIHDPRYKIYEYIRPYGGWKTYNEFLARKVKRGCRPIERPDNDNVIVSPADMIFQGYWPIVDDSSIIVKNESYSIPQLISNSRYHDKFKKGVFAHGFLEIFDYHRLHIPVSGKICEAKKIPATTWINEKKTLFGKIKNDDDVGFQFEHTRAYVIIDSPIGYIALIAVGMGHISSIILTIEEADETKKGDEFGYFAFGGSDIVMLFEREIDFTAKKKKHYNMGEKIAMAINQ